MNARQQRALRGAAAASVAVTLAAVSHTVAGGSPPAPLIVLGVIVLAGPVTTLLAGRMRPMALAAAVVVAQVMLHVVFWASAGTARTTVGMDHMHTAAPRPPVGEMVMPAASGDPLMLAAHVLAAIGTFALLHRGESLLRAVSEWVGRVLARAITVAPSLHPLPRAAARVVAPTPSHPHLTRVSRRGPPALSGGVRVA